MSELILVSQTTRGLTKFVIHDIPALQCQDVPEGPPVGVVANRQGDPLIFARTRIAAVGRHGLVVVSDAPGTPAVVGVVQETFSDK